MFKLADKLKALELLGKHFGMFTDKLEHSGSVEINTEKLDAILFFHFLLSFETGRTLGANVQPVSFLNT